MRNVLQSYNTQCKMADYFSAYNRDSGEPSGWEGVHDKEGSGRMESVRKEGEGKG